MLALRLLTGIPLAIAAIWFVLTQNTDSILYALIVIAAIAGWEWAGLAKAKTVAVRIMFALVLSMTLWSMSQLDMGLLVKIQIGTTLFWLCVVIFLSRVKSIAKLNSLSGIKLALGIVAIIPAMLAMWMVHRFNIIGFDAAEWLLFGMSLVWVADIGAYFAGRKFGKIKLAPVLSPGKTREGFYGAMLLTLIYSLVASVFYFKLDATATVLTLIMTFVLTIFSVAGDLFESLLKRSAGVKDSGKILPGHGGVLDRIDSLTATMSLFAVSSIYIYNLEMFLV
ncbi:MAG: phosphatidate cytidylyltransferase [Gammaproteobacteria bacterium]|nr:phosphatidate cytidylyltransferase [Gammaproteobacteria bacterium]